MALTPGTPSYVWNLLAPALYSTAEVEGLEIYRDSASGFENRVYIGTKDRSRTKLLLRIDDALVRDWHEGHWGRYVKAIKEFAKEGS